MSISASASFSTTLSDSPVLAVRICPPPMGEGVRRPYHLALLIDVSGSMDGERIAAVKRTLHLLLDAMMDGDRLSLIQYESIATTLVSGTILAADTRSAIHTAIDTLHASGGTNMESAIRQLMDISSSSVDSVFLLTDGRINQGIASSTGLLRMLSVAVPAGTPVNTLGFGAEHNSRMLRDMSVRSRGSYTYADAAELLPAIIGDIMGGLASEIGRNAHLSIPDGWECMEYGADATVRSYGIGTLVAEKPQWVVLKGASGTTTPPPDLVLTWVVNGVEQTQTIRVDESISAMDTTEQYFRAKVASTFAQITELLETHRYMEAKTVLEALGRDMDASNAHTRPFVLQLRAQVDEMLESVTALHNAPPPPMGRLHRTPHLDAPLLAPVLSRLASNTTTLSVQRGYLSQVNGGEDESDIFSSQHQRRVAREITANYTQAI